MGDWETDHPDKTISQCVTSHETELADHAASIAKLEADKGTVDGLFPNSVEFSNLDFVLPDAGVTAVAEDETVFGYVYLPFLRKGGTNSAPNITVNNIFRASVIYFDGKTADIPRNVIRIRGNFKPGSVCLRFDIPTTSILNLTDNTPLLIHIKLSVTVSEPVS